MLQQAKDQLEQQQAREQAALPVEQPIEQAFPDAAARFAAISVEKPPTLVMDEATMKFAKAVFSSPPLSAKEFEGLIKQWLFLSTEQNSTLTQQLEMEDVLKKFAKVPRLRQLFKQKEVYTKVESVNCVVFYLGSFSDFERSPYGKSTVTAACHHG